MKRGSSAALLALTGSLLAFGPRPGDSPLFKAVARGDLKTLEAMAQRHADLFERDSFGRSGLVAAAQYDKEPVARFFLRNKADIDARDMSGYTALHYAAETGDRRLVDELLAAQANPQVYSKRCHSPLDVAAGYSRQNVFDALRRRLAALPLPKDGTVEECKLNGQLADLAATRQAFHARMLTIDSVEDYGAALESLRVLAERPAVGAPLMERVLAVVDHPSPEDAPEYRDYDLTVRQTAVETLSYIAKSKAQREMVANRLAELVETGGCAGYRATHCDRKTVDSCQSGQVWGSVKSLANIALNRHSSAAPAWPRDAEQETCFNCRFCDATRIGNGFRAAMAWFHDNPGYADVADAALNRPVQRHALPQQDYQALKKRYLSH